MEWVLVGVGIIAVVAVVIALRLFGEKKANDAAPAPLKAQGASSSAENRPSAPQRESSPSRAEVVTRIPPEALVKSSERKSNGDEEEPEGTKVASVRPQGTGKSVLMLVSDLGVPGVPQDLAAQVDVAEVAFQDDDLGVEDPTGPQALILVTAVGRTDAGRRRKHNEDSYLVLEDYHVFVIADGMGGYAAGEVASQLAVDVIAEAFNTKTFVGEPQANVPLRGDEFVRAIQMSNTAILTQARANPTQTGMGTTLVGCRFSPNKQRVYIAHVGDSRCYRVRGNSMKQMTVDHTLGAAGITGPAAAKLSRAVGIGEEVEVDLTIDSARVGDIYILCSDGLSKMVPDEMITSIVVETPDIDACVKRLIDTANERGGRDNVTVILIRVEEPNVHA